MEQKIKLQNFLNIFILKQVLVAFASSTLVHNKLNFILNNCKYVVNSHCFPPFSRSSLAGIADSGRISLQGQTTFQLRCIESDYTAVVLCSRHESAAIQSPSLQSHPAAEKSRKMFQKAVK